MTPPLFLLDPLPPGDTLVLDGDEGRHAARVKRLRVGEPVYVSDGHGERVLGDVQVVGPDSVTVTVRQRESVPQPAPRLVVAQALAKGDRAELAVETMTELGVDEILPWAASRSIVQWTGPRGDKSLAKWRTSAREAAKQSRRARVPLISEPVNTTALCGRLTSAAVALVLHEDARTGLDESAVLTGRVLDGDIVVVVGPEGGISPDELTAFGAAGGRAIRLGDEVLRTSTAGAAVLAALSVHLGRWS